MVPDVVGNFVSCSLHSLGRTRWTIPRNVALVMARRLGCYSRSGSRYDSSADIIASACLRNAGVRAGHRFHLCHGCSRDRTQQDRTGKCVPRHRNMGLLRRIKGQPYGLRALLDRTYMPTRYCLGLLLVLPKRAVITTVDGFFLFSGFRLLFFRIYKGHFFFLVVCGQILCDLLHSSHLSLGYCYAELGLNPSNGFRYLLTHDRSYLHHTLHARSTMYFHTL